MKTLSIILVALFTIHTNVFAQTAWGYYFIALKLDSMLNKKDAIFLYTKALESNPTDDTLKGQCFFNRAWDKQQTLDYKGAVEDWTSAISIFPTVGDLYYNRGVVKDTMGNYNGAIPDFTKAIELNPNDWQAYCDRGHCKDEQGNNLEGIDDFTKSISIFPNKIAYYDRGCSKFKLGNLHAALADLNAAIEIDSTYANAYSIRAEVKKKLGDVAGAKADYKKAEQLKAKEEKK